MPLRNRELQYQIIIQLATSVEPGGARGRRRVKVLGLDVGAPLDLVADLGFALAACLLAEAELPGEVLVDADGAFAPAAALAAAPDACADLGRNRAAAAGGHARGRPVAAAGALGDDIHGHHVVRLDLCHALVVCRPLLGRLARDGDGQLGFEEVLLDGRLLVEDLLEVVELELLLLRDGLVEGRLEDLDNDRPEAVFFEAHPVLAGDVEELIPRAFLALLRLEVEAGRLDEEGGGVAAALVLEQSLDAFRPALPVVGKAEAVLEICLVPVPVVEDGVGHGELEELPADDVEVPEGASHRLVPLELAHGLAVEGNVVGFVVDGNLFGALDEDFVGALDDGLVGVEGGGTATHEEVGSCSKSAGRGKQGGW